LNQLGKPAVVPKQSTTAFLLLLRNRTLGDAVVDFDGCGVWQKRKEGTGAPLASLKDLVLASWLAEEVCFSAECPSERFWLQVDRSAEF
jgi:hypothetical protein